MRAAPAGRLSLLAADGATATVVRMTTDLDRLGAAEFMLLTTFRRDRSAAPTPVWVAPLDGGLAVWTVDGSAKVKRIRRDPTIALTECDRVGEPHGDTVKGQAEVLDAVGTARVRAAVSQKYGLTEEQLMGTLDRIGGGGRVDVGLAITLR